MVLNFFVDFDGTISLEDLGDKVFKELGKFEPYHTQLVNKEITIKEYWHELCENLNEGIGLEDFRDIAKKSDYDYYFSEFYNWTLNNNFSLRIVSDGFDVYINEAFKILGIENIEINCNSLIEKEGKIYHYFYGEQENCNCLSASCKRNVVLNNSNDNDILIYIGDGYSDFCPAEHCDIVFAKKNLATYCNEKRIPHYPYKNFFDVKQIMLDIIKNKKVKKRNFASIKRKNAFESE